MRDYDIRVRMSEGLMEICWRTHVKEGKRERQSIHTKMNLTLSEG